MDFPIDWIEPNILAASSIPNDMRALNALYDQGIRAIVSLTENAIIGRMDITANAIDRLDITYLHQAIPDGFPPEFGQAESILDFIDRMAAQKRPTFIHCHAGIGRTGTMLHAYFLARGYDLKQAENRVKLHRPACAFSGLSDSQRAFLLDFAALHRPTKF